jgi:hypothetical protein
MRTTVNIPEHLLVEAKKLAAQRRMPVTRLFEESLRDYLAGQRAVPRITPPPLPVLQGPVPVAGLDLNDTSQIWEFE